MKFVTKSFIPVLFLILFLSSCYYDNLEELHPAIPSSCDTTGTITYNTVVKSILNSFCVNCHVTGGGGTVLDNYTDVCANSTMVIKSIKHDPSLTSTQWMPRNGGMLDSCDIKKIEIWVAQGKLQ